MLKQMIDSIIDYTKYDKWSGDNEPVKSVEDGSVINVWNDIDSIFELHQFVLEKDIDVEYLYDGDGFDSRYGSAFKGSIDKARDVFGVE